MKGLSHISKSLSKRGQTGPDPASQAASDRQGNLACSGRVRRLSLCSVHSSPRPCCNQACCWVTISWFVAIFCLLNVTKRCLRVTKLLVSSDVYVISIWMTPLYLISNHIIVRHLALARLSCALHFVYLVCTQIASCTSRLPRGCIFLNACSPVFLTDWLWLAACVLLFSLLIGYDWLFMFCFFPHCSTINGRLCLFVLLADLQWISVCCVTL